MNYVIAYDLGTGGMKSSLYDQDGKLVYFTFASLETFYNGADFREQRPADWWEALISTTKELLGKAGVDKEDIVALGCSGYSLGVVPIGRDGRLLVEYTPIWNDARAVKEACELFRLIPETDWYLRTGNGFPAQLYGAFKIRWYKNNMPELYGMTDKFIGTKDYLNYRLTGKLATDHSYASGSGVYDLLRFDYIDEYISALGISREVLPEIMESTERLGTILPEAADEIGLSRHTLVALGGVDNACMTAGAGCIKDGMSYTSLGTSSWIAVSSHKPIVNGKTKPYVFAHLIKGMYLSAESIFCAGNCFRWLRDQLCPGLCYREMDEMASLVPPGSHGLIFTPAMSGGNAMDKSVNIRGSFNGLDLKHTRPDMIRSVMEGVCLNLKLNLDELARNVPLSSDMLIVGGGGKSELWRQMFSDVYNMEITESVVGEDAGSLGAMACAAVASGLWKNMDNLAGIHRIKSRKTPNKERAETYARIYKAFLEILDHQADIGDIIFNIQNR